MLTTTNYGLKKPEGTDVVNIDDFNGNADIIDTKLKEINSALPLKAPLDSPGLTGAPTAPTQTPGDNSTKIANTAFVTTAIANKTSVSGNAGTATKLQTPRNIALAGDVTGSANFDGSGNISITTTVADDSHNHIIANVDGLQSALDVIDTHLSDIVQTAAITFENGWVNYGNGYDIAKCVKVGRIVHMSGMIANGIARTICHLPVGFRPNATQSCYVKTATTDCQILISTDGGIHFIDGDKTYVALNSISFIVD